MYIEEERIGKLLDVMARKPHEDFDKLCEALRCNNQPQVASLLEKEDKNQKHTEKPRPTAVVPPIAASANHRQVWMFACLNHIKFPVQHI